MPILAAYMMPHPALAVPEIGDGDEAKIPATSEALRSVSREIASLEPETIIVISPHAESYSDYIQISDGELSVGSFGQFRHPEINFRLLYDTELVEAIGLRCSAHGFPGGSEYGVEPELDHGTMVPLYFINQNYTHYKVVRIGVSGLSPFEHYQFGIYLREAVEKTGRKVVVIASGDLSHCQKEDGPYGYKPEGPAYDLKLLEMLKDASFDKLLGFDTVEVEEAEECGHRGICIMAGLFDGLDVEARIMSHENTFGVGYAVGSFKSKGEDKGRNFEEQYKKKEAEKVEEQIKAGDPYVAMARASLEEYTKTGKVIRPPEGMDKAFRKKAGAFVSLHKFGSLRGCIGTIKPTKGNLAGEIIANAIEAGSEDPRFEPIRKDELPYILYTVDVVSPLTDVLDKKELDPHKYGLIVSAGPRRGVLLPNLPGIDDADVQIAVCRRKAGIPKTAALSLQKFETERHE